MTETTTSAGSAGSLSGTGPRGGLSQAVGPAGRTVVAHGRRARAAAVRPEQACPVAPVLDIVLSRWTTPILWTLHEYGRQRFAELQRTIATITPKVLTQRLRQLERDGLVVRTYHPEVPPRVEYEISDLGRSLAPLFAALSAWAQDHLAEVERARRELDVAQERFAGRRECPGRRCSGRRAGSAADGPRRLRPGRRRPVRDRVRRPGSAGRPGCGAWTSFRAGGLLHTTGVVHRTCRVSATGGTVDMIG